MPEPALPSPTLLPAMLIAAIERAVNAALRSDPASAARLSGHAGRRLAVRLTLPPATAQVLIAGHGVDIQLHSEATADVTVTGNPVDLAALLFNWQRQPSAIGGSLRIEGDRELLQALREIAGGLNIDRGALLEPSLGGELAQQIDFGGRRLFGWAQQALSRLGEQVSDYLAGESGLMALRRDVYAFCQDVDELRGDVDRLEARIQHLQNRKESL